MKRTNLSARAELPEIEETSKEVGLLYDFASGIFRGVPANPNKHDVVRRLQVTFDPAAIAFQGNSPQSYENFIGELESALFQGRHVALVGNRGIGKTACVNRWLNE
ncbi:MAG: hypothetical protein ABIY37_06755, partial [Devosia sp.]